jgi:hypothetical protein
MAFTSESPFPVDISELPWEIVSAYQPQVRDSPLEQPIPEKCLCEHCVPISEDCEQHRMMCRARIGTASMNAEVYDVEYGPKKIRAAFKVLPITSNADRDRNTQEILWATRAAQLVESGASTAFPLVYGSGECNIKYSHESRFLRKSREFQTKEAIADALPTKQDREAFMKRFMPLRRVMAAPPTGLPADFPFDYYMEKDRWLAQVLMSELAWGDLVQFAKAFPSSYKNALLWSDIVRQGLSAIHDAQRLMNLYHNDLHWGNFLVVLSPQLKAQILMHDFGKSYAPSAETIPWNSATRLQDAKTFLEGFAQMKDRFVLRDEMDRMLEYISDEIAQLDNVSNRMPDLLALWDDLVAQNPFRSIAYGEDE